MKSGLEPRDRGRPEQGDRRCLAWGKSSSHTQHHESHTTRSLAGYARRTGDHVENMPLPRPPGHTSNAIHISAVLLFYTNLGPFECALFTSNADYSRSSSILNALPTSHLTPCHPSPPAHLPIILLQIHRLSQLPTIRS